MMELHKIAKFCQVDNYCIDFITGIGKKNFMVQINHKI